VEEFKGMLKFLFILSLLLFITSTAAMCIFILGMTP